MSERIPARVLIIDDDVELTAMLAQYLRAEGFEVQAVHSGEDGVHAALAARYDIAILDVMLPRLDGMEALRLIRRESDVPVIMLTAKGDDLDRARGMELGADDYVPKPYFPRELVARIRAVLRRNDPARAARNGGTISFGDIQLDLPRQQVTCGGRGLDLTASEFKLLVILMQGGDAVAGKEELTRFVLGRSWAPYDRSIDVHVSNLRQKLARCGAAALVETVRGVGYRLVRHP